MTFIFLNEYYILYYDFLIIFLNEAPVNWTKEFRIRYDLIVALPG